MLYVYFLNFIRQDREPWNLLRVQVPSLINYLQTWIQERFQNLDFLRGSVGEIPRSRPEPAPLLSSLAAKPSSQINNSDKKFLAEFLEFQ